MERPVEGMLPATLAHVTPLTDHRSGRSPGDGGSISRIGDPEPRAIERGDGSSTQGAARRTFARHIDCSSNESKGPTPHGGRRAPARGGGGRPDPGSHAA